MMRIAFVAAALVPLAACTPPAPAGDPVRGEERHHSCLQCHGTELYVPPKRKIDSPERLQSEVERWAGYYNPAMSEQDVADLVAYLNRDFYRFP